MHVYMYIENYLKTTYILGDFNVNVNFDGLVGLGMYRNVINRQWIYIYMSILILFGLFWMTYNKAKRLIWEQKYMQTNFIDLICS